MTFFAALFCFAVFTTVTTSSHFGHGFLDLILDLVFIDLFIFRFAVAVITVGVATRSVAVSTTTWAIMSATLTRTVLSAWTAARAVMATRSSRAIIMSAWSTGTVFAVRSSMWSAWAGWSAGVAVIIIVTVVAMVTVTTRPVMVPVPVEVAVTGATVVSTFTASFSYITRLDGFRFLFDNDTLAFAVVIGIIIITAAIEVIIAFVVAVPSFRVNGQVYLADNLRAGQFFCLYIFYNGSTSVIILV